MRVLITFIISTCNNAALAAQHTAHANCYCVVSVRQLVHNSVCVSDTRYMVNGYELNKNWCIIRHIRIGKCRSVKLTLQFLFALREF